jgi:hypothetical protein
LLIVPCIALSLTSVFRQYLGMLVRWLWMPLSLCVCAGCEGMDIPVDVREVCGDSQDNDSDGLVDCDDP